MDVDVVVVGARCAGSPTAMLLARRGYSVMLLDRASFPSDTLSTHLIWPTGLDALDRWGLLSKVWDAGTPPIEHFQWWVWGRLFEGSPTPTEGGERRAACPRRTILDAMLVDAAREAGADVRTSFAVREILREEGREDARVVGVRGRDAGGDEVTVRARMVVGADGMRSTVARAVGAEPYDDRPPRAFTYYGYWEGLDCAASEVHVVPGRYVYLNPTNHDRTMVAVGGRAAEFRNFRDAFRDNVDRAIQTVPGLPERIARAELTSRIFGTGDVPFFFRRAHGAGWALVGDAGYHKDPITAQGITDAFIQAERLAQALDEVLSGERAEADALADYVRDRDAKALPVYRFTMAFARLDAPSGLRSWFLGRVARSQTLTDRFFGTLAGTEPVERFFSMKTMARSVFPS